jgi:hypothetical protein
VADAQGTSYYSDATVSGLLSFQMDDLAKARAELITAGFIAFRAPYYQVLSLAPATTAVPAQQPAQPRLSEARSAGDILRSILKTP